MPPHPRLRPAVALLLGALTLTACGSGPSLSAAPWSSSRFAHAHARVEPGIGHTARPTTGNLRIGALFDHDSSGDHFCSGSVVNSPGRNLILTAAHCIHGGKGSGFKTDIVFVPGYRSGQTPNGQWQVKSLLVDPRWSDSSDPDLDVAFVVLQPLNGRHIADLLGGNKLGIDQGFRHTVRITGYPSSGDTPVTCNNTTSRQSAHQLRIACTGFPGGTSGSPWVTAIDRTTHTGTVIGTIGGYQQGGDSDSVSYSAYFDSDIQVLYNQAVSQGG